MPVVDGATTEADRARQRDLYRDMVRVCVAAEACGGVTLWGFTDAHSWITDNPATFSGEGSAHPFDEAYRSKPALDGIREALRDPADPSTVEGRAPEAEDPGPQSERAVARPPDNGAVGAPGAGGCGPIALVMPVVLVLVLAGASAVAWRRVHR